MKHTVEQLISISHRYFPRGIPSDDPRYDTAPEIQRQRDARSRAANDYPAWRGLLGRLGELYPGTYIENRSIGLQSRSADNCDRCFGCYLELPHDPSEPYRYLGLFVSFVVPYYTFHHLHANKGWDIRQDYKERFDFILPGDAEPYAIAIAKEVEAAFPGHERMPGEIALTLVPEVAAGRHLYGEALIFDCLFSDIW